MSAAAKKRTPVLNLAEILTPDDGVDGRVLAGNVVDKLRVRRDSRPATDILGDAKVAPGESAVVVVNGFDGGAARKPRRKLKLVGKDGAVTREVDDVALLGALAVRAEIETAKTDGRRRVGMCQRCEAVPVVQMGRAQMPKWCKACKVVVKREQMRASRAANPKKEREQARARRAANPEKYREVLCAFRAANREKIYKQNRAWRAANPEKMHKRDRAWRAANPEKIREKCRAYRARKKAAREAAAKGGAS